MSDLMDDLDSFFEKESITEEDRNRRMLVLPMQVEECVPGNHAVVIGRSTFNPLEGNLGSPDLEVGFIYDETTWTVAATLEGPQKAQEQRAEAEKRYDEGLRWGKWYSAENPSGVTGFRHISDLMPCSAEEAEHVQMADYKAPIVATFTDWFRDRFGELVSQFKQQVMTGLEPKKCELCGEELVTTVDYTGFAAFKVYENEEGEKYLQMVENVTDQMRQLTHAHLMCPNKECIYNEHLDLAVVDLRTPGALLEDE